MSPADSPFAQLPAPGPHPATAELRAYAGGTLGPTEQHRIEAHLLDCARCADLADGFAMTDAAPTDQAVAQLRTRLQARVGTTEPVPVATRWAWPRVAAAAALLGVVGGGIWGWQQHDPAPIVATAHLETSAPAPASTPESVAKPAASVAALSPPAAAVATAPEAAKATAEKADCAAVTPAQSARASASGPVRRARRATAISPTRVVVADREAAADNSDSAWGRTAKTEVPDNAVLNEGGTSARAAPTGASVATEAAPAKRSKGLAREQTAAADTAAYAQKAVAGQFARAKAAPASSAAAESPVADKAAAAIVAATPMPAAPAIAPAPVGGSTALREYLRREAMGFDPEINNLRLTGTVRVKFMVGADGKLSNLKVVRGLRADYDAEALRIVCEGPAWQPGIAGGRRAPLPMEVVVPF